jgi:hypothetical protein
MNASYIEMPEHRQEPQSSKVPWVLMGCLFGAWAISVLGWLHPRTSGDWLIFTIALPASMAAFLVPGFSATYSSS